MSRHIFMVFFSLECFAPHSRRRAGKLQVNCGILCKSGAFQWHVAENYARCAIANLKLNAGSTFENHVQHQLFEIKFYFENNRIVIAGIISIIITIITIAITTAVIIGGLCASSPLSSAPSSPSSSASPAKIMLDVYALSPSIYI